MKIVIDARMKGPRWTGIGLYLDRLIDELPKIDRENHYVVLLQQAEFDKWKSPGPNFSSLLAPYNPYSLGEQFKLAWRLYRLKPNLVHFGSFNAPILYFGTRITTIHDLTLMDFSTSRYTGLKRWLQGYKKLPAKLVMWWAIHCSKIILVPSQYVSDDIVRRYHVSPSKLTVTREAVDPVSGITPEPLKDMIGESFLLHVGNYYPHKDIPSLIRAMAKLQTTNPDLKLVLSGRPDFFLNEAIDLAEHLGVRKNIITPGFTSVEQRTWLYQNAKLFIFPSMSEGFGLPGLEAMAEGAPVLAANASCLPEIYANAAEYFEPRDPDALAATISKLLASPYRLGELKAKGRLRIKDFSWQRMAEQTLAAYQKALR